MKSLLKILVCTAALAAADTALAWWNGDWSQRLKITLNTSDTGAGIKETASMVPVLVRLHTGNFLFTDAKPDGSDLRFVSADDKVPYKFHIEKFDATNELALVWVQVPRLAGGAAAESMWLYYGNPKAPKADDAKGSYDSNQTVVLHFAETEGAPRDQTGYAHAVQSNAAPNAEGLIGAGAGFKGGERVTIGPAPTLKIGPTGGFTFTAWVKPAEAGQTAELFAQKDGAKSVVVGLDKGRVYASVSGQGPAVSTPRAELAPGVWSHVAVTASDQLTLYVNGQPAGASPVKLPELEGTVTLGAGFSGELDEVTLSNVARATGWIGALAAGQGAEQKLVTYGEAEGGESGGSSYLSILLGAVTLDGWVVIGILMVMMVISVWVMISKALTVVRTDKANEVFLERFRASGGDLTSLAKQLPGAVPNGTGKAHASAIAQSSLLPLYSAGIRELDVRLEAFRAKGATASLSAQSINAIRATLDAGYVRLTHKLNSQMVLLTIAISGGPFLGLLGTVVGVMITFAAIAAAGDVNVNAIAPGIAAALVATVAGLAVAIPALFGYNYLASRIKNINADMQVFCDEFVTRLAEQYS